MEPEVPAPWEPRPKAQLGVRGLVGGVGALKIPEFRIISNHRVGGVLGVAFSGGGEVLEATVSERIDPQTQSGEAVAGIHVIVTVGGSDPVAVGVSGHAAVLLLDGNLRAGTQVDAAEHQVEERVVLRGG